MKTITYNTDAFEKYDQGKNIFQTRRNIYKARELSCDANISICIFAYNRLDKTKKCVESVLKYTDDVDYNLILIDNGSDAEMYSYFESIDFKNKKIIRITKNAGPMYAMQIAMKEFEGNYFVLLANDIYVTKYWLSNLLKCCESDARIGFVTAASNNVSNLQEVNLRFNNLEDMYKAAEKFNISNPNLWQERLRLINIVTLLKREVIDNVGLFDAAFFHDFLEDDFSARVRRAGYKLMLCGDTFVYHDHDFRNLEDKNYEKFNMSLEAGRQNYIEKYYGLDAWDDINNYEVNLINMLPKPSRKGSESIEILGIDVKCGTPILEIRNFLRKNGITNIKSSAYTTNAKYFSELIFATDGNVYCDRMEYISEKLSNDSFDYIILGEPINLYNDPIKTIQRVIELSKIGGKILFKLRNISDVRMFLKNIGMEVDSDQDMPNYILINDFNNCLKAIKVKKVDLTAEYHDIDSNFIDELKNIIRNVNASNADNIANNLCIKDYLFCIER